MMDGEIKLFIFKGILPDFVYQTTWILLKKIKDKQFKLIIKIPSKTEIMV